MITLFIVTCRFTIAGVLLVAVYQKLRGRSAIPEFVASVRRLSGAPKWLATQLAFAAIAVEFLLGVALLVGVMPALTTATAGLLMMGYAALLFRAKQRRLDVSCNCFGGTTEVIGWRHVGRNLGLTCLAFSAATLVLSGASTATPSLFATALSAAVAVCLVVLIVSMDDLFALFGMPAEDLTR